MAGGPLTSVNLCGHSEFDMTSLSCVSRASPEGVEGKEIGADGLTGIRR